MAKHKTHYSSAQKMLGQRIEQIRIQKDMTRLQLGKAIRVTDQQITKYEAGAFIPLSTLEKIGEALDEPISKKMIRLISSWRNAEREYDVGQDRLDEADAMLIELYDEALPLDDE